jgi:exo-beta-1,3-glucanase (GH17 family)
VLRLYGADGPAEEVLALVRERGLAMKVLLGAWIEPEGGAGPGDAGSAAPTGRDRNRAQVEAALRLAAAYPDVVLALCVGNETQVGWSDHRVDAAVLVGWLREVRRRTALPVTTADDFTWWLLPESAPVAREVDLVVAHVHPAWHGQAVATALAFTQERHAALRRLHPALPLVLGEVGWPTRREPGGEQARLIRGEVGEEAQRAFYEAFTAWAARERVASVWFEAFDERWKGGPHPDDAEKHWGLFRADRTPKRAVTPRRRRGRGAAPARPGPRARAAP